MQVLPVTALIGGREIGESTSVGSPNRAPATLRHDIDMTLRHDIAK
jgi:hypothetical protein